MKNKQGSANVSAEGLRYKHPKRAKWGNIVWLLVGFLAYLIGSAGIFYFFKMLNTPLVIFLYVSVMVAFCGAYVLVSLIHEYAKGDKQCKHK